MNKIGLINYEGNCLEAIKNGDLIEGKVNDKTGIITWEFMQGISGSKSVYFDYSIDAQYGIPLYLE